MVEFHKLTEYMVVALPASASGENVERPAIIASVRT